jgi:hypothetical protein
MFFPESEAIAREHPELREVIEQVDHRLSGISSPAPLRPADFSSVLGAEENQVVSAFDLLAKKGVVSDQGMVECRRCQNLMPADALRQAVEDEDQFECTACGHAFSPRTVPICVYRMTPLTVSRTKANVQNVKSIAPQVVVPTDEPLADRAQLVLVAMLELGAIDSDARQSTQDIAAKALGAGADANALKGVMADLKTRQLLQSKTGRNGGCWLLEKGLLRAKKLRP